MHVTFFIFFLTSRLEANVDMRFTCRCKPLISFFRSLTEKKNSFIVFMLIQNLNTLPHFHLETRICEGPLEIMTSL